MCIVLLVGDVVVIFSFIEVDAESIIIVVDVISVGIGFCINVANSELI